MPPHDDEIRIPLTYTNTYYTDPLTTGTTAVDPNIVTTTYTPGIRGYYTYDEYRQAFDQANVRASENTLDVEYLQHKVRIALDNVLDHYFRTLYKVIKDHCSFDISEDEFIKLIKEDKND